MENEFNALLPQQQEDRQVFQETPIYKEAVNHFRMTNYYYISFGLLKIAIGFTLLYYNHQQSLLNYWIVAMIVHSFIMILVQKNHLKYLSNNKRILAYKLDQIIVAPINDLSIDQRRLNILSRQIKLEVIKQTLFGKWFCRVMVIIYQIIFAFGVYLFCSLYNYKQTDILYQYYFLSVNLVISLYQYIDLYLILLLAVLGSPFLIIFAFYYCANQCNKEQERNEIKSRLQIVSYKPAQIEGDQECLICRCPYELNEKIIILQCSRLHHFHEQCIMVKISFYCSQSWININNTCPLCRRVI